jgi:hypothetical protein
MAVRGEFGDVRADRELQRRPGARACDFAKAGAVKGSSSFLKKRTKKLWDLNSRHVMSNGVQATTPDAATRFWSLVWPVPLMLGLVVVSMTLCRLSGLLLLTSFF